MKVVKAEGLELAAQRGWGSCRTMRGQKSNQIVDCEDEGLERGELVEGGWTVGIIFKFHKFLTETLRIFFF